MNLPPYFTLAFDQLMMVVLTIIIAFSVVVQAIFSAKQAKYVKEQARLSAESEARSRERERPRIRITHACYGFGEGQDADGNMMDKPDGLPTSPQAQQQQQDVINTILAA